MGVYPKPAREGRPHARIRGRCRRTAIPFSATIASKTYVFETITTLNGVEPQAWLTDVLERMISGRTKAHELERLLPWVWKAERLEAALEA